MLRHNKVNRQERFNVERRVSLTFGYIIDMIVPQDEEDEEGRPNRYMPVVALANSDLGELENQVPLPMIDSPDFLAANYGSPTDLIGRKVKIEYIGSDWKRGMCSIVSEGMAPHIGGTSRVEGTGFIFARAGAVND